MVFRLLGWVEAEGVLGVLSLVEEAERDAHLVEVPLHLGERED